MGQAISSIIELGKLMVQSKQLRAVVMTVLAAVLIAAWLIPPTHAKQRPPSDGPPGRPYCSYALIVPIDWGRDELAQRINRSGVAASTNAHSSWRSVPDQAIADSRRDPKPIAAVGHSIGGD